MTVHHILLIFVILKWCRKLFKRFLLWYYSRYIFNTSASLLGLNSVFAGSNTITEFLIYLKNATVNFLYIKKYYARNCVLTKIFVTKFWYLHQFSRKLSLKYAVRFFFISKTQPLALIFYIDKIIGPLMIIFITKEIIGHKIINKKF